MIRLIAVIFSIIMKFVIKPVACTGVVEIACAGDHKAVICTVNAARVVTHTLNSKTLVCDVSS